MSYSRSETIKLTGLSGYHLSSLNSAGIVKSVRLGNNKCSKIEYTEEQIKILRLIKYWKEALTEQEIKVVVESIGDRDLETVGGLCVVLVNGVNVWWLENKEELGLLIKQVCDRRKKFVLKFVDAYKNSNS